jgi:hypothetical protein
MSGNISILSVCPPFQYLKEVSILTKFGTVIVPITFQYPALGYNVTDTRTYEVEATFSPPNTGLVGR